MYTVYTPFNNQNPFIYLFLYLVKPYRSLIALILPVIFICSVIFAITLCSCFYSKRLRHWMPFMCWCAIKKLLTHSHQVFQTVRNLTFRLGIYLKNNPAVAYAEGGQGGHGPLQWLRQKWGRGKKEMFAVKLACKFWASEVGHVSACLYQSPLPRVDTFKYLGVYFRADDVLQSAIVECNVFKGKFYCALHAILFFSAC